MRHRGFAAAADEDEMLHIELEQPLELRLTLGGARQWQDGHARLLLRQVQGARPGEELHLGRHAGVAQHGLGQLHQHAAALAAGFDSEGWQIASHHPQQRIAVLGRGALGSAQQGQPADPQAQTTPVDAHIGVLVAARSAVRSG